MRPWFHRLPTAAKLLLLLSLALLPIGLAMIWAAQTSIDSANAALDRRAEEQDQAVARSIEALIARNALALRIAANAALASPGKDDCEEARRSLASGRPSWSPPNTVRAAFVVARVYACMPNILLTAIQ